MRASTHRFPFKSFLGIQGGLQWTIVLWFSFIFPCSPIQLTKQRVWLREQDLLRTISGARAIVLLSEPKRAGRRLRDDILLTLCSSDLEAGKRVLLYGSFVFSPPLFFSVPSALTSYSSEVVTTWRHWQEKILYIKEIWYQKSLYLPVSTSKPKRFLS